MKGGRTTRLLAAGVLAAAAVLASGQAAASARSDWRVLTVGHFRIYSTLGDGATRDVARQLSAFEQTVGEMLQTGDRLPDTPTLIYLIGARDFNQYAAFRPGLGGFFHPARFANLMVVNADLPFKYVRVALLHEFVHYIQRNTSAQKYPPWFTEGYAELFSGFSLNKDQLEYGSLPSGVRMYRGQWIPVERVLAVTQADPEYQTEKLSIEFYGESWALVHYLLFDDKSLLGPTQRYLANIDSGYPEGAAFADAFPFDKTELDRRLQAFVRRGVILVKQVRLRDAIVGESAPITRLSAQQADLELTRLIWMLNDRVPATVAGLMQETLALQPDSIPARALAARIAASHHRVTDTDELVRRYAGGGADDPQVRIDLADTLLNASDDPEAAVKVSNMLADLTRGDAPDIEAVELWTRAAELSDAAPDQIIAALKPVLVRAPHNTSVLRSLARAAEQAGDKAAARDYYNQIILVSGIAEERRWAQKQADAPRLQP